MQPLTSVKLSDDAASAPALLPPRPRSLEETGLSMSYVSDLVLRGLYLIGEMTGQMMVDLLHLPWDNVIDQAVAYLRREQMAEVKGAGGIGENRFFPLFARVSRNFGAQTKVDFYAGVALGGRLKLEDANGAMFAKDDYSTAPLIGLTLSHRY